MEQPTLVTTVSESAEILPVKLDDFTKVYTVQDYQYYNDYKEDWYNEHGEVYEKRDVFGVCIAHEDTTKYILKHSQLTCASCNDFTDTTGLIHDPMPGQAIPHLMCRPCLEKIVKASKRDPEAPDSLPVPIKCAMGFCSMSPKDAEEPEWWPLYPDPMDMDDPSSPWKDTIYAENWKNLRDILNDFGIRSIEKDVLISVPTEQYLESRELHGYTPDLFWGKFPMSYKVRIANQKNLADLAKKRQVDMERHRKYKEAKQKMKEEQGILLFKLGRATLKEMNLCSLCYQNTGSLFEAGMTHVTVGDLCEKCQAVNGFFKAPEVSTPRSKEEIPDPKPAPKPAIQIPGLDPSLANAFSLLMPMFVESVKQALNLTTTAPPAAPAPTPAPSVAPVPFMMSPVKSDAPTAPPAAPKKRKNEDDPAEEERIVSDDEIVKDADIIIEKAIPKRRNLASPGHAFKRAAPPMKPTPPPAPTEEEFPPYPTWEAPVDTPTSVAAKMRTDRKNVRKTFCNPRAYPTEFCAHCKKYRESRDKVYQALMDIKDDANALASYKVTYPQTKACKYYVA